MKKRIFTEEEIKGVIYNYEVLKMSRKRSGEPYHISEGLVKRLLEENGIHVKTIQETNCSKYKINDNYFSTQGHNQAYIIGFLAADGNISNKDNRIDLELFSEDKEILDKIRMELQLEREVKIYQCKNGYVKNKLYFYSAQIKRDLMSYGIVPNKTYSDDFDFPYLLKEEYLMDYIRGYFDGNGSCKKGTSLAFQIDCPSLKVITGIRDFLFTKYNVWTDICLQEKEKIQLYRICYYGDRAKKIYQNLYTPNSLFLQRKRDKLLAYYNEIELQETSASSDEEEKIC